MCDEVFFVFLSLKVNKRVPAEEDTEEWDAIQHGVCPSGGSVSVAGPTPSASGHTAHHVHGAQTPGGQPDHWTGAAPGETLDLFLFFSLILLPLT